MTKREGELKSKFGRELKLQCPLAIVLFHSTAGAPDRSITFHGQTTMWEFKHGTPNFESPGYQELICQRLAAQGHCFYVIWQDTRLGQRTLIVLPSDIKSLHPIASCQGFNMVWLVRYVREMHGC